MEAPQQGDELRDKHFPPGNRWKDRNGVEIPALLGPENRIVRLTAFHKCVVCQQGEEVVAREAVPEGVAYRAAWASDVAAGRALPIAGDLFDAEPTC